MPIVINGSGTIAGLSNDSLSGNLVDGGTVSAFASTGIDDNASSGSVYLDGTNVGFGTSSPAAHVEISRASSGSMQEALRLTNDPGSSTPIGTGVQLTFAPHHSGTEVASIRAVAETTGAGTGFQFYTHSGGSLGKKLTLDRNGNMGLGVTPESWHSSLSALQIGGTGAIWGNSTQASGYDVFLSQNQYKGTNAQDSYLTTDEASRYGQWDGTHVFMTAPSGAADSTISWTTVLTLQNNGTAYFDTKLGVGTTTMSGSLNVSSSDTSGYAFKLNCARASGSSGRLIDFHENTSGFGNPMGSITSNGGGVAYNTSSDYRLKENLVPLTDSIERVKALKPYRFNFLAEPDVTVDGFVAHEAGEVVPEAVSGEKDAMRMEEYEVTPAVEEVRDDDGNITVEAVDAVMGEREVIDPQGIDQSKIVPLITAALQTALSQIEDLTARIESLEAQ